MKLIADFRTHVTCGPFLFEAVKLVSEISIEWTLENARFATISQLAIDTLNATGQVVARLEQNVAHNGSAKYCISLTSPQE